MAKEYDTSLRDEVTYKVTGKRPRAYKGKDDPAVTERKKVDRILKEIELAEKFVKEYHDQADKAVDAYLDDQPQGLIPNYRLNLFHANIETLESVMFSRVPKVEADRRYADPNDDVARVAGEIVTRILQNDMNDPEDKYLSVLKQALKDRLTAGMGCARVRYSMEEKESPVEGEEYGDENPVPTEKTDEWTDIEYVHWRDMLWSPCRTSADLRWKAFRVYMTKAEVEKRFGEAIAREIPYATRGAKLDPNNERNVGFQSGEHDEQAEIFEFWNKATKTVCWVTKGYSRYLDEKKDFLEFDGFWPDAKPMYANLTTRKYLPKPDYTIARDLYEEINELEARLAILTKACKVVGVYPAAAKEVQRVLTDGVENQLIPVENWAMFIDKGGLKGQIDYFPVKDVVEAIMVLGQQQQLRIQQLYQVTGMSDIIRGQATAAGTTATEQRIKAQFASTRMQSLQDTFAEFATDLLNKKLTIIRKFYDPVRILKLSNLENTPDAQFAPQAIELIKNPENFNCRVVVRADSMAQIDYDMLKMERTEFLAAVSGFLQSSAQFLEGMPEAAPFLLELLKFNLAGYKGAKQMEGVVDQAIASMIKAQEQKAAQPPEPSPEEKKMQGEMQMKQMEIEGKAKAEEGKAALETQKMQQELMLKQQEFQMDMQRQAEEHKLEMQKLRMEILKMVMDLKFKREEQSLKIQGQQQEHALDMQVAETEATMDVQNAHREDEREDLRFEREEEHADRAFDQQERHAEAAARRARAEGGKNE